MSKEKIIVALDVATAGEAVKGIDELRDEVGAFKIGLQLFTAAGAGFVREIVNSGAKIFLDLKFHDIPNTVAKASIEAARLGVWMFNLHASGGSEMMRRAVEEVRDTCERENLKIPKIIAVTVLTSSNKETLREIGIKGDTDSQVLRLAHLANQNGLDGVVVSPLEARLIRQNIENKNFLMVTPGIRTPSQNAEFPQTDDQKRIMTPAEAINAGSNYIVIGRPILKAENPAAAVREILKEIDKHSGKIGGASQLQNL